MKHFFRLSSLIFLTLVSGQVASSQKPADKPIEYCDSLYLQGSFSEAMRCYNEILEEERNKSIPSITRIMSIVCNLGEVCEDASRLQDALLYYSAYLKLASIYSPYEIGEALNLIGNVWFRMGKFEQATEFYYRAMYFNEKHNRPAGLSSNFNNLGNVFFSWGKYDKALPFYLKSIELKRSLNDYEELPSCLINAGNASMLLEHDSNALYYYQEAMRIASQGGNLLRELSARVSIGVLEEQNDHLEAAEKQFQIALSLTDTSNSSLERIMALRGLGSIGIKRGDYPLALKYLDEGYRLASEAGLRDVMADFLELRYKAFDKSGDYKSSLDAFVHFISLKDSMFNAQSNDKLLEFEGRYKNSLRQKTIELQQIEIDSSKKDNRFLILLTLVITIAMFIILMVVWRNLKHRSSIQHHVMEARINQARQQALRAQINPHFVSNALNSIQNYYLNGDLEKATGYMADFGQLIRSVLECSTQNLITVAEEIKFLNLYLTLEQLRMSNKFTWEILREGELNEHDILIPPLLVQPYVENSIWHGISHLEGHGHIKVVFRAKKSMLIISIEDNGVGIEQSMKLKEQFPRKRSSYAMSINRERIRLLKEFLKQEIDIELTDLAHEGFSGTRVIISIPEQKLHEHV